MSKEYFNTLAPVWDGRRKTDAELLRFLVEKIGLRSTDVVADLGCGTGVLLPWLAARVIRVYAVDYAEGMLEQARKKCAAYTNISFANEDVMQYRFPADVSCVTCLNFYPHVEDKDAFVRKLFGLLPEGGMLTIMHDLSRAAVNKIHGEGQVTIEDKLLPAEEEAQRLRRAGFAVTACEDTDKFYFLQGKKFTQS